jgi:hypothetical protein
MNPSIKFTHAHGTNTYTYKQLDDHGGKVTILCETVVLLV